MAGHREIIEHIESWPGANSPANNTVEALTAIYHLLDERLPEKPMRVISTAPAPEDKSEIVDDLLNCRLTLDCTESGDIMSVTLCSDGDFEFTMLAEGGIVYLSPSHAARLARAILAAI